MNPLIRSSILATPFALSISALPACSRAQLQETTTDPFAHPALDALSLPEAKATAEAQRQTHEIVTPMKWISAPQSRPASNEHAGAQTQLDRDLQASRRAPNASQALALAPPPKLALHFDHLGDSRLPPDAVARELAVAHRHAQVCYATALREDGALRGRADVDFVVDRTGEVSNLLIHARGLHRSALIPCIANGYGGLHFAPPSSKFVEVSRLRG